MADVVSLLSSERLKWSGQPVIFHHGKFGKNIELSQNNSVVTSRVRADKLTHYSCGIAVTREPVSIGVMLKVTVMKTNEVWHGGLVSSTAIMTYLVNFMFILRKWDSQDQTLMILPSDSQKVILYAGQRVINLYCILKNPTI